MHVQFVGQPHGGSRNLHDFLAEVAGDEGLTEVDVVVAWAKRSGLRRVRGSLETIRQRQADLRLIVGIDEGGATRQGLQLARELFSTVHVFHDKGSGTFHPKIYLATGPSSARLFVGSNNLTAGGVYFNYEAAIECVLDLPADDQLLAEVRGYIDRLRADANVCLELDDDLMKALIEQARYRVRDEDTSRRRGSANAPEDLDSDEDPAQAHAEVSRFGASGESKRSDPAPSGLGLAKKIAALKKAAPAAPVAKQVAPAKAAAKKAAPTAGPGPIAPPPTPPATVLKRWFRKMDGTASQHPPSANSNPTGNLRLTMGNPRLPIDTKTWHRHELFGPLAWTSQTRGGGTVEVASGQFRFIEMGTDRGMFTLQVDHAPHREAGQSNILTVLHWGPLEQFLAATDHTGHFVMIERLSDGTFRLEIKAQENLATDHIG